MCYEYYSYCKDSDDALQISHVLPNSITNMLSVIISYPFFCVGFRLIVNPRYWPTKLIDGPLRSLFLLDNICFRIGFEVSVLRILVDCGLVFLSLLKKR